MAIVAVATNDGVHVNEHFGMANSFVLYEVDEAGVYRQLETRTLEQNYEYADQHSKAYVAAQLLKGVESVLVSRIGPHAAVMLEKEGIKVFEVNLTIDQALVTYGKKSRLIRKLSSGCSGCNGCTGGCG